MVEAVNIASVSIKPGADNDTFEPRLQSTDSAFLFKAFFTNKDNRDPDDYFPFILGCKVIKGKMVLNKETGLANVFPQDDGKIYLSFSVNMLEINEPQILSLIQNAPKTTADAEANTYNWLNESVGEFTNPLFFKQGRRNIVPSHN
ncbi:MAG: hypothetical protein HC896_15470 [Bacteroidales bacterium]|nr:hypothetical protein [Bacteroidales bacterium]